MASAGLGLLRGGATQAPRLFQRSVPSFTRAFSTGANDLSHLNLNQKPFQSTPPEISPLEKYHNFQKSRYPIDPSLPLDPLLRNHQVKQVSKLLKTLPKDQLDKAKQNRTKYVNPPPTPEPEVSHPLDQASTSFQKREDKRVKSRAEDTSPEVLAPIQHAEQLGFGNIVGETFPQLLSRNLLRTRSVDSALGNIVGSSKRTNADVNQAVGVQKQEATDPHEQFRSEQLDDLQKFFPQYFPQPGQPRVDDQAVSSEVQDLAEQHYATPEQRRSPVPTPERTADLDTRVGSISRLVENPD